MEAAWPSRLSTCLFLVSRPSYQRCCGPKASPTLSDFHPPQQYPLYHSVHFMHFNSGINGKLSKHRSRAQASRADCHDGRVYNSNVVDLQYLFICTNLFVNLVIVFKRFCLFLLFYLDKWFSVHPFSRCVCPLSSVLHQLFCFLQPWSLPNHMASLVGKPGLDDIRASPLDRPCKVSCSEKCKMSASKTQLVLGSVLPGSEVCPHQLVSA